VGRLLTLWLILAGATFSPAAAGGAGPRLPVPRPAPLSDFYVTIRALGAGDSLSGGLASLRGAGARLEILTEQLPESLPLQTVANTVIIAHRRSPKYRASIERLLWRRLDPALSSVAGPEELAPSLEWIATQLRPLCGTDADSVRMSLQELYKSDVPGYLATVWPRREPAIDAWIRGVTDALRPHESSLLAQLGKLLAVSPPDSSRIRILVVSVAPPPMASAPIVRDGRATIVLSSGSGSARESAIDLLCGYLRACYALAPEDSPTAERVLSRFVRGMGSPSVEQELQRSLLRYAVSRELAERYGWEGLVAAPGDSTRAASFRKNWDAYAAGGISLSTACAAIASDASGGGR
jgi:hypothetical protein